MSLYLGVDTSNYTTSAALFDSRSGAAESSRQLLRVKPGAKGLRQSDALYEHVKAMPQILAGLNLSSGERLAAAGCSSRPRDIEGSYMPCFEAGVLTAKAACAAADIPYYEFSHQAGHIASALFSIGRLDILDNEFLAFHVSGGTTEAVYIRPSGLVMRPRLAAQSLDLKAGQTVDRVGLMLGLDFPAGRALEALALKSDKVYSPRPTLKGADCCLSGLENKCSDMLASGEKPCDIARFCIDYIRMTLEGMLLALGADKGGLPVLFAGGVMSDSIIRDYFSAKYGALFAKPEYSTDNAVGIAVMTWLMDAKSAKKNK
jgi:N6-L-threonylcarbamoyladenine synthase